VNALDGILGGVELLLPPVSVLRWRVEEVGDVRAVESVAS
jgi:hypothetical protein